MPDKSLLSHVTVVCMTGTLDQTGGAEKAFLAITDGIRDRLGASTLVVTHVGASERWNVREHRVLRPSGEAAGFGMLARMREILLEVPRPAVLFPFQINSNIVGMAANLTLPRAKRLPAILNDRASIDFMTRPTAANDGHGWWHYRAVAAATRFTYRRADHVVCNARRNAEKIQAFIGRDHPPVSAIYNPLPAREIQQRFAVRDRSRLLGARPRIAGHGRLHPQKGWDTLLRAFARVVESIPDAELEIVGEGPERPRLEALAVELGIAERCRLLGFSTDPLALIESADVYVLPSRFEGLPNSLLEAIAVGLPAVAADCPTGPDEILGREEEHGLLVPVDAVDELAAALIRVIRDDALRARLAASARARALDFTLEQSIAGYAEVFRELIDKGVLAV